MLLQTGSCPWALAIDKVAYGAGCELLIVDKEGTVTKLSVHRGAIRSIVYVESRDVLVTTADDKRVLVICMSTLDVKHDILLRRKASAVVWKPTEAATIAEENFVILDKFGEATRVTMADLWRLGELGERQLAAHLVKNPNDKTMHEFATSIWGASAMTVRKEAVKPIQDDICDDEADVLGSYPSFCHLATITCFSTGSHPTLGDLLVTGDRDEKIRVGSLGVLENTQWMGLGHREFISDVLFMGERVVSAAADKDICFWDTTSGERLGCLTIDAGIPSKLTAVNTLTFLALVEKTNGNQLLTIDVQKMHVVDSTDYPGGIQAVIPAWDAVVDLQGRLIKRDGTVVTPNLPPIPPSRNDYWKHNRRPGAPTEEERRAKRLRGER
ncbi:MAG: uncharacterized protein KVP18_002206 [Porospora cf. gigantea A]|uniref:uncharacterized protein n=2 Tax=Porospora cf. gigantea A TaxID=2853593 RepID=UPI00355A5529|nr:MAG: hypothetical protein KVP18_002206 [Porospora cf. gigantea A]